MIDFSEKSYIDSVVTRAFGREDADADISGTIRTTHFTKLNSSGAIQRVGRKRYKGEDANGNPVFEKVKNDIQFRGRCYLGDGSIYIDVSVFVTGTLTARAKWFNSGSGWEEDHEFTTEIDNTNKRITLQDTHKALHIEVYEDAVLVAEYSGCEQEENEAVLSDILVPNGNNATLVNGDCGDFCIEDSTVPYSWLNIRGYSIGGSGEIIQGVRLISTLGTDGNSLAFKDSLAPRLQLLGVNNAYILNGVDQSIRVGYEPSSISINGVDDTANWTITDVGGGEWDITPNAEKNIYNILIDDKHYPCSDDNGIELAQYPINTNPATITNATLPDILTSVDDFHQHFYYGYWKYEDANGNKVQRPSDCGFSFIGPESVIFNRVGFVKGFKQTGKWNGAGKLYFPDIAEVINEARGKTFDSYVPLLGLFKEGVVLKEMDGYVSGITVGNDNLSKDLLSLQREGFLVPKIWLKMDEGSGIDVFDSGSDGLPHPSLTNASLRSVDLEKGNVVDFPDVRTSANYIEYSSPIYLPENYLISVDLYRYSNGAGTGTDLSRSIFNTGTGGNCLCERQGNFWISTGVSPTFSEGYIIGDSGNINEWQKVGLMKYNDVYTLYLNNEFIASHPVDGFNIDKIFTIGRQHDSTFPENYRGKMSNFQVFEIRNFNF